MNIENYSAYQKRLINDLGSDKANLMHMAAGIAGEAGEVLDIVKKHFAYNKPLDKAHLVKELGDTLFYMSGLIDMIDSSWAEVMDVNIKKLEARYPDGGFDAARAINKDEVAEGVAIHGSV